MRTQRNLVTKLLVVFGVMFLIAGCASVASRYSKVMELDTIEAYEEFILKYPDSEFAKEAMKRIEELEYEKAKSENTVAAYEEFILKYPDSEFISKAKEKIAIQEAHLDFETAITRNTIESYKEFIGKHPESDLILAARKRIVEHEDFETAETKNTIEAYKVFIENNPESNFVKEAEKRIKKITLKNVKKIRLICNKSPGSLVEKVFYDPKEVIALELRKARFTTVPENSQTYDVTLTINYEEAQQCLCVSYHDGSLFSTQQGHYSAGVLIGGSELHGKPLEQLAGFAFYWAVSICNIELAHEKYGYICSKEIVSFSNKFKAKESYPSDKVKWSSLFEEAFLKGLTHTNIGSFIKERLNR